MTDVLIGVMIGLTGLFAVLLVINEMELAELRRHYTRMMRDLGDD